MSLTCKERFLNACQCKPVDRPPMWMMRQAGRSLPEYRKMKEKYTFVEIVQNPELAAEATLQPIRRFGFDAAILFSDILVIPEAMGQTYSFREGGGIQMEFPIRTKADVDRLSPEAIVDHLHYTVEALTLTRKELGDDRALLGFCGSPWTLANFMIEGESAREYNRARQLFYDDPSTFNALMEKLTQAAVSYLQLQIDAGADAVQIFDSHAGVLAPHIFEAASGRWMKQIIDELDRPNPVILFARGAHDCWDTLAKSGASVLGVDWLVNLANVKKQLPASIAVQGNLDPLLLTTRPEVAARETARILEEMRGLDGHIFNLGHGVPATGQIANIEAIAETVRSFA